MSETEETNLRLINRTFGEFRQSIETDADEAVLMASFAAGWNARVDQLKKELAIGAIAVGRIYELEAKLRDEEAFGRHMVDVCANLLQACEVAVSVLGDIYGRESTTSSHGQRVRSDISENIGFIREAIAKANEQAPA